MTRARLQAWARGQLSAVVGESRGSWFTCIKDLVFTGRKRVEGRSGWGERVLGWACGHGQVWVSNFSSHRQSPHIFQSRQFLGHSISFREYEIIRIIRTQIVQQKKDYSSKTQCPHATKLHVYSFRIVIAGDRRRVPVANPVKTAGFKFKILQSTLNQSSTREMWKDRRTISHRVT